MADEGRIQGGIRVLYAHYRLSDYKQTSMTLRDKTLIKEVPPPGEDEVPLWFEGHMDWTFMDCQFDEPFFFGVEGDRLEGDDREEFPPYGSNALHFKNCTMNRYFEIAKNCVVIFENCTFKDEAENPKACVTLGDNTKAEFRDCTFEGEKGPVFSDYCNVHFLRCSFNTTKYCMKISEHCELTMHSCNHSKTTEQTYITIDGDSLLDWYGENSGSCGSVLSTMTISDRSIVKVHNHSQFTSTVAPTFAVSGRSKLELRDVSTVNNTMAPAIQASDSYVYERNVETQKSTMAPTINIDNSTFRGEDIGLVKSTMGHALAITNRSQMDIDGLEKATSTLQNGFDASADSKASINNFDNISSTLSVGAKIFSGSKCVFQDGQEVISQLLYSTEMGSDGWGIFKNVTKICCGASVAIEVNNARFTDKIGVLRQGKQALRATNSTIEIEDTSEKYYAKSLDCIAMTNSTYDIRRVTLILANALKAFIGITCQGAMSAVETIRSKEDDAVYVSGAKGPLEWDNITLIESLQKRAMVVDGDLYGWRACRIQTIRALQDDALVWDQTAGDTFFYEIDTIETLEGDAFHLSVTGRFWGEKIENITTEQGDVMDAFASSGEITLKDIGTMSTQEGNILNLRSDPHDLIRVDTVDSMTTQQGQIFDGDSVKGQTILANIESASTQEGDIIHVSCGNEPSSFFRVVDNKSLTTQESKADAVGIKECANIQLHRNDSINALEAKEKMVYLTGIGPGFGRIEVLDNVITTNKCVGGIWFEDSGTCFLMGTSKSCEFKPQTCDDELLKADNCSLTVKNYSAIEATSGTGYGVYFTAQVGGVLNIGKVESIKHEKAAFFTGKGLTEISGLTKIEAVKEDGVEVADDMEIRWLADTQIIVSAQTKTALKISQTRRNNYIHKLTAPVGKLDISQSDFRITEATFSDGDTSIDQSTGELHSHTLTKGKLDITQSEVGFFDFTMNGTDAITIDDGSVVSILGGAVNETTAYLTCNGVLHLGNMALNRILGGSANSVIHANKCIIYEIANSGTMMFNNVNVTRTVTHDGAIIANHMEVGDIFTTNAATGVFLNDVDLSIGGWTGNAVGTALFANKLVNAGGMAGAAESGYFLNRAEVGGTIAFASESGILTNGLIVSEDFAVENLSGFIVNYAEIGGTFGAQLPGGITTKLNGYILNHVTIPDDEEFLITDGCGVVASWIAGGSLTLNDVGSLAYTDPRSGGQTLPGSKGLVAGYVSLEEDVLVGDYCGTILAGGWIRGDTTVNEYGGLIETSMYHYNDYPTGDGAAIFVNCLGHRLSSVERAQLTSFVDVSANRTHLRSEMCALYLGYETSNPAEDIRVVTQTGATIKRVPSSADWDT